MCAVCTSRRLLHALSAIHHGHSTTTLSTNPAALQGGPRSPAPSHRALLQGARCLSVPIGCPPISTTKTHRLRAGERARAQVGLYDVCVVCVCVCEQGKRRHGLDQKQGRRTKHALGLPHHSPRRRGAGRQHPGEPGFAWLRCASREEEERGGGAPKQRGLCSFACEGFWSSSHEFFVSLPTRHINKGHTIKHARCCTQTHSVTRHSRWGGKGKEKKTQAASFTTSRAAALHGATPPPRGPSWQRGVQASSRWPVDQSLAPARWAAARAVHRRAMRRPRPAPPGWTAGASAAGAPPTGRHRRRHRHP